MSAPVLQISNLTVAFGRHKVLHEVSLEVPLGAAVGLAGESGSGKTMIALAIMGLLPWPGRIAGGQIRLGGQDLTQLRPRALRQIRGRRVAMVFQEPMTSLNPVFTVGSRICELLRVHKKLSRRKAKATAAQLLDQVGIEHPSERLAAYPHELSGGQKQRVMIAMALACEPDILIADEPTTALDVTVQKRVLEVIEAVRRRYAMSLLFITHDLGVMARMVDEVAIIRNGRICEQAATATLFRQPKDPYTRGLIACRPHLNNRRSRLLTLSDVIDGSPEPAAQGVDTTTAAAGPRLLTVDNLSTWFKRRDGLRGQYLRAVDDASFHIRKGETFALVGESGSGKTTLARTVLRLVAQRAGRICFDGIDVSRADRASMGILRRRMQVVFQDPYGSLNPRMTVLQAMSEPMQVHRLLPPSSRRDRVVELLEQVGLEAVHLHRFPHQFSGGQRQRIGIARALAVDPEFIVCDECVSSLDVSVQAQVLNLLKDLQHQYGLTYLFISHDLAVVSFIADRIAVMKSGRIVEQGRTQDILSNPQVPYTQSLLEAVPRDPLQAP